MQFAVLRHDFLCVAWSIADQYITIELFTFTLTLHLLYIEPQNYKAFGKGKYVSCNP